MFYEKMRQSFACNIYKCSFYFEAVIYGCFLLYIHQIKRFPYFFVLFQKTWLSVFVLPHELRKITIFGSFFYENLPQVIVQATIFLLQNV